MPEVTFEEFMSALEELLPDGKEPTEKAMKSLALLEMRLKQCECPIVSAKEFLIGAKKIALKGKTELGLPL